MVGWGGPGSGVQGNAPPRYQPSDTRTNGTATSQTNAADEAQRYLQQLQQRNSGLDFWRSASNAGLAQLQKPIPGLDFALDPRTGRFKLTLNTARGGLNVQRDRLEVAHAGMSTSDLLSHSQDEVILNFVTTTQSTVTTTFPDMGLLNANFEGRCVMAARFGKLLFAETSQTDATILQLPFTFSQIYSLANVVIAGVEYLVVCTGDGAAFISSLDPFTIAPGGMYNYRFTDNASASYVAVSIIQSPLPGNPLIVRTLDRSVLLVGTEASTDESNPLRQKASVMLRNVAMQNSLPIGYLAVGGRPPAAYFLEELGFTQGLLFVHRKMRLSTVNAYGHDYQHKTLDPARLIGAAANYDGGTIVLNRGWQVTEWDGRENDLGIFANDAPASGTRLFCAGVCVNQGQIYALVEELPYLTGTGESSAGRVRSQWRKYDHELRAWFPISAWLTLTESGTVYWIYGYPGIRSVWPAQAPVPTWGAPDLPFGEVTRQLHAYANVGNVLRADQGVTWYHKYEPQASINPFTLRGLDQTYATTGALRWAGEIFPPGYEYADKYITDVEWGGQDTGGSGSSVKVEIGERDRMDETNPGPLHHTFTNGVSHAGRVRHFANNQTSFLFPQIEVTITRGTSNLTPQALPITVHGYCQLPDPPKQLKKWPWGRSKG